MRCSRRRRRCCARPTSHSATPRFPPPIAARCWRERRGGPAPLRGAGGGGLLPGKLAVEGGDELFAGNSRYAKQLLFENYQRIPSALRRGVLEPVVGPLGRALPASAVGKLARYIEQARAPLPDRAHGCTQ